MTHDTSDVEFDAEGVTLRGTFYSAAERPPGRVRVW